MLDLLEGRMIQGANMQMFCKTVAGVSPTEEGRLGEAHDRIEISTLPRRVL